MSPPSVAGALREVFDADAKSLARALDSRDASTTTRVGLALDVVVAHAANDLDAVFEPSLERVVACRGARCAFVARKSAAIQNAAEDGARAAAEAEAGSTDVRSAAGCNGVREAEPRSVDACLRMAKDG